MGLLERWDERNQRAAEWQQEIGRRHPNPPLGRAVATTLIGMAVLSVAGSVATRLIGEGLWIAILVVVAVACFLLAYRQAKRQRRGWESKRSVASSQG